MTDVSVQYFSHLNGLQLDNRWGDMIALLDTCLVNGIVLPYITDCIIDESGNLSLTFDSPHKALLFQIVEFKNFIPATYNGKYRIIGVPNTTQLILKTTHTTIPITIGQSKLSPLGYEIIFTDTNKRVYRALNPRSEHPFIRVDESLTSEDGTTGVYTSTYAKSAMVGLIENMTHIDDYQDPGKLQLPLNTTDFSKNWKITGTGATVIRGWSKWYWAKGFETLNNTNPENSSSGSGPRNFTLVGDSDCFYLQLNSSLNTATNKFIIGCGLYESALKTDVVPNWFLMSTLWDKAANTSSQVNVMIECAQPLVTNQISNRFQVPSYNITEKISNHSLAYGILPSTASGSSNLYPSSTVAALQIPFNTSDGYLRGSLKHLSFAGKNISSPSQTNPILSDNDMYLSDNLHTYNSNNVIGGVYYYLGEL